MKHRLNWIIGLLIAFPIFLYPMFPDYSFNVFIENFIDGRAFDYEFTLYNFLVNLNFVLVFVVAATGLNVQTGFAGQLNLGFVGFMAIGGYTAAILQMDVLPDFYQAYPYLGIALSVLAAAVAAAFIGLVICIPTLRLRGDYFAIVTFGFAELVRQVIKNEQWTHSSMGINDIMLIPESHLQSVDQWARDFFNISESVTFRCEAWLHYVAFAATAGVIIYLVTALRDSHYGRALFALRDNPTAAEACGISLTKAKMLAFVVSSAIGGLAGYMVIIRNHQAHPDPFIFMVSIYVLCGLVFGGMGNIRGTVLGTIILMSLGENLRDVLKAIPADAQENVVVPEQVRYILFGVVLVLMMRFRPNGLISLESDTRRLAKDVDVDKLREDGSPSPFYKVGDKA